MTDAECLSELRLSYKERALQLRQREASGKIAPEMLAIERRRLGELETAGMRFAELAGLGREVAA